MNNHSSGETIRPLRNMKDDYLIYVTTGDKKYAGTDANVFIILHDEIGNSTPEIRLDKFFRDDFERGQTDVFRVARHNLGSVDKVVEIELWRDDSGFGSAWYVNRIVVENARTAEKFVFPILRWVKANFHQRITINDTSLPQNDEHPDQRKKELEEKMKEYQFESPAPGLPVRIKDFPDDEHFSWCYEFHLGIRFVKAKGTALVDYRFCGPLKGKWKNMDELENFYISKTLPLPKEHDGWKDDLYFGRQRLASVNSNFIRLCTEIPEKLAVNESILKPMLQGNKIKDLLKDKRIYICDYEILEGNICREGRTLCVPIGLFMVDNNRELRPIAIQLFQKPAADNPVFLPTDHPTVWTIAKMWYNNADAAYHQSLTHLGSTHLNMEGIAISTHRNLSLSHPLFKLMGPHFLYVLAINSLAYTTLLPPGGWVDTAMTTGAKGMIELVGKGMNEWRMDVDGTLPADLKNRGVDDVSALPNYHYRDDALLLYDAIKNYVTKYVDLYYKSPNDIQGDWELRSWAKELSLREEKGGVGILGIPNGGHLKCNEDIVLVVTCIIYTCSVTHAAANFLQYEQYAFPANYPSLMTGSPPTTKDAKMAIIDYLPDKDETLDVMVMTDILSQRVANSLGNFEVQYVHDPEAVDIVNGFRANLKDISKTIQRRNKSRKHPYDILDPKLVPNSISI